MSLEKKRRRWVCKRKLQHQPQSKSLSLWASNIVGATSRASGSEFRMNPCSWISGLQSKIDCNSKPRNTKETTDNRRHSGPLTQPTTRGPMRWVGKTDIIGPLRAILAAMDLPDLIKKHKENDKADKCHGRANDNYHNGSGACAWAGATRRRGSRRW